MFVQVSGGNVKVASCASVDTAVTDTIQCTRDGYAYASGVQRIDPGKHAYIQLIVNDSVRAQADYTQSGGSQTGSEITSCYVRKGERVYAKCYAQYSGYSCGAAVVVPIE